MYDVWDWFDYSLNMVDGRVFNSSTMFNEIGDALDDAIDRSVRVQGTIETIEVFEENDYQNYY